MSHVLSRIINIFFNEYQAHWAPPLSESQKFAENSPTTRSCSLRSQQVKSLKDVNSAGQLCNDTLRLVSWETLTHPQGCNSKIHIASQNAKHVMQINPVSVINRHSVPDSEACLSSARSLQNAVSELKLIKRQSWWELALGAEEGQGIQSPSSLGAKPCCCALFIQPCLPRLNSVQMVTALVQHMQEAEKGSVWNESARRVQFSFHTCEVRLPKSLFDGLTGLSNNIKDFKLPHIMNLQPVVSPRLTQLEHTDCC